MIFSAFGKKNKMGTMIIASLLLVIFTSSCGRNESGTANIIVGHEIAKAGFFAHPAWSTHGDKIAFDRAEIANGPGRIFIYDPRNPNKPRLLKTIGIVNGLGPNLNLRWSPDDKRLVEEELISGLNGNMASVVDIETGKQAEPGFYGSNFFWLDDQNLGGIAPNNSELDSYSLSNGKESRLFDNVDLNEYQAIFKHRYLLSPGPLGAVDKDRQVLVSDLKTGKSRNVGGRAAVITAADNGRAIVISVAHWSGRGSDQRYIPGTVRSASLSPTKLKTGKVLKFADNRGKTLRPITVSISPNGKLVAFTVLAGRNKVSVYLAKLP